MNNIFGKQIGRYTLLEQLGAGGMATVYNAYDNHMNRNVALKVILPSKQHSSLFMDRFLLEAKALAQLSHTNVVKVLDYGEEDGLPYLVMEFVKAGTLKERMQQPWQVQEAATLLAPIARALDYVHSQKIIHRDVKPANILIDENGIPKISDFGIVKLIEDEEEETKTIVGVGVGTPDYMSPEQGMGNEIDERADIYALGIVFFEMITGEKPFSGNSPMGVVIKHVTDTFPKPSSIVVSVPKLVDDVIKKATAKDIEQRFVKMSDFADVLEKIARGNKSDIQKINKSIRIIETKRKNSNSNNQRLVKIFATILCFAFFIINSGNLQQYFGFSNENSQMSVSSLSDSEDSNETVLPGEKLTTTVPENESTENTQATTLDVDNSVVSEIFLNSKILLADQPLPEMHSTEYWNGIEEIARWGYGNSNDVQWSKDGSMIAIGGTAGVFIFSSDNHKLLQFINTPDWINCLQFTEDGTGIISGSLQNRVQQWNILTGTIISEYEYASPENVGVIGGEIAPQVTSIALSNNGQLISAGYSNGVIDVWNLKSGQLVLKDVQSGDVTDIEFSKDDQLLYVSGEKGFGIWNLITKKRSGSIESSRQINTFVINNEESLIYSGGQDWMVRRWEVSGRLLDSFSTEAEVNSINLSPDGNLLAIGNNRGEIIIWDVENWEEVKTIDAHAQGVRSVSFSPDGKKLVSTSWAEEMKIWSIPDLKIVFELNENVEQIEILQVSPNNLNLASGSQDGITRLWDIQLASIKHTFEGYLPKGNAFSPDSEYMVTVKYPTTTIDEGLIYLWNVSSGELVDQLDGYQNNFDVYFSDNGELLIAGNTRNAKIWDATTFNRIDIHGGQAGSCGVYYSADNEVLAVLTPAGVFYDYSKNLITICALKDKRFTSVKFIPNENRSTVIVKQISLAEGEKGIIFSWDYQKPLTPPSDADNQHFQGSSQDQKTLFIGSEENDTFYLKAAQNVETIFYEFPNFNEYEYVAATTMNDDTLFIGGNDGVIHIWGHQ